tara:strand:+ start:9618 stop:10211 length:594 start_codon:yes stop_codon:yes gene_type:complete
MKLFQSNNENEFINPLGLGRLIQDAQEKAENSFDIQKWFKDNPIPNQHKVVLKFKNESTNEDPFYSTEGSSGFDLRANLDSEMSIGAGAFTIVPTGLFFEIPEGFEIQIRPRSGLAANKGVTVLNSPGTIDWDYRGEIKVILINHGRESFIINHGDRIAQGVMAAVAAKNVVELKRVNEISTDTDRGEGRFGSTGNN